MTDKIKNTIYRLIDTRDYKYSHFSFTDDTGKAFDLAIRSLQAWEEVLNELENIKNIQTDEISSAFTAKGIGIAIDIINKHLAEIEE